MTHTEIRQADLAQFTEVIGNADEINELLRRYGVKFGIYKNGTFKEQFFPFDPIPRVIPAADFKAIEQGLVQRVNALNEFLFDIYHDKKIVQDGIIPEDFIYISKGYLAQCEGITPPERVCSHISGIDLVQGMDGIWYILEDNLRIPSGASYPLIARELTRIAVPDAFRQHDIVDNRNYANLLRETMESVNLGGIRAILTPGRYNAAYFEHSYLAELTGSVLVQNDELFVEDNQLYQRTYNGGKTRIGVLYRRISDEYLDPLSFYPESVIGIPEKAAFYAELLSDQIEYEKGATTTKTTAAESFALGKGVCQDFAHILIAILRKDGIPARYIAGLAFCDGETHAWVEYWNADHWEGFDPANNCPVSEEYLVLSQGRDFGDCAIDRGVMLGSYTRQMQLVRSALS